MLPVRDPAWLWLSPPPSSTLGGLASTASGDPLLLWYSGHDDAVALDAFPAGRDQRVRTWPVTGVTRSLFRRSPNLRRGPTGELYAAVTSFAGLGQDTRVDLGGGPRAGAQTVELRSDGTYARTVLACCDDYFESTEWLEDVDANGNMLVGFWSTGPNRTTLVRSDGREVLLHSRHSVTNASEGLTTGCESPRFTPDGYVVCGGAAVVKLDLDGRVVWTTQVERDGHPAYARELGVTARGTIVAAGSSSGPGYLPSDTRGFVAAIEPNGQIRFVRDVLPAPRALAVDPAGRAAMLASEDWRLLGAADVLYSDLDGNFLWRSTLPSAQRIAFAGDRVVVAGDLPPGTWTVGEAAIDVAAPAVLVMSFGP